MASEGRNKGDAKKAPGGGLRGAFAGFAARAPKSARAPRPEGETRRPRRPARPRPPPFVLKPYSSPGLTGPAKVASWFILPTLFVVCLIYGFFYALTTPYLIVGFASPLLILLLLTIWALPDLRRAPTGVMEVMFNLFLVSVLLWPGYLAIVLPGLPWITPIRFWGLPLFFMWLICLSVSRDYRAVTAQAVKAIPGLWKLTIGFAMLSALSIVWSTQIGDSINRFIDTQVSWTAIFFASCFIFLKPGRVERWAYILWGAAIILCVIGVFEARVEHPIWAGHLPPIFKVEGTYVENVLQGSRRLGTDKYRVTGTHSTSLGLAEFLALCTPFVLHFMVTARKTVIRVLAALSIPFIFYTIMQTDARLGMVGFFMACLLTLATRGVLRWRNVKGSLMGPAIVLSYPALFVAFMTATFFVARLRILVWGGSNDKYSNEGRKAQLHMAIPKLEHRPWGFGVGRGADDLGYRNLADVLTIDTYWLLVALDYGIIGFFIYYATILVVGGYSAFYGLTKRSDDQERNFLIPIAIAMAQFFIIKSIFSQTENHPLIFMMMGMAAALVYRIRNDPAAIAERDAKAAAKAAQAAPVRPRTRVLEGVG